jgi:hypothetical protein
MQVTTTTAPAAGLGQGADGTIYIAHYNGMLAGYLADYEVKIATPLLLNGSGDGVAESFVGI